MSLTDPNHPAGFNRPPRLHLSEIPAATVDLPAPPHTPDLPPQNLLVTLIPVLGVGVMALFFILRTMNSSSGNLLLAMPLLALAVITIGGSILANRLRQSDHKRRVAAEQLAYIRLLERKRVRLQAAHDATLAILRRNYRPPASLLGQVLGQGAGVWDRRPEDADFARVRIGTGRLLAPVRPVIPDPDRENESLQRVLQLAEEYRFIQDAPVALDIGTVAPLGVYGSREQTLGLLRAMLCQLAVTHAPQDLHIHVLASREHYEDWRWLGWLPHVSESQRSLEPDWLAFGAAETRNLLGLLSQVMDARTPQPVARTQNDVTGTSNKARSPLLLVIFDDGQQFAHEAGYLTLLQAGGQAHMAAVCLAASFAELPGACQHVIETRPDAHFRYDSPHDDGLIAHNGMLDSLSRTDAEHVTRALARIQSRPGHYEARDRVPLQVDLLALYQSRRVEDLSRHLQDRWLRPSPDGVLPFPVPIGRESLAVTTLLALDDDHHGPHGVLAGTTGSGKSELLQSLVCALALEHHPNLLNFLLIDFKGGSTFNVFSELPHTVGMVTNLDGALVKRVLEALKAETEQRQQFLKQLNVRDVTQYHRFYGATPEQFTAPDYRPLPHLCIIVDEFAQLAREMPEFLSELVRTAQVGRSLGLHLILGTQSPMDVITDEMNDNLQFRICLRVQNVEASRAMLRRPDAAYLPPGQPGRGYLQVGERGLFKQFQTAYAGSDYAPGSDETPETMRQLQVITAEGAVVDLLPTADSGDDALAEDPHTVAHAIAAMITTHCAALRMPVPAPLLLPPLPELIGLETPLTAVTGGWDGDGWGLPTLGGKPLVTGSVPVGMVDDVYRRTQQPLWLHFPPAKTGERRGGHLLITGGVGTGKTTALRTLLVSLGHLYHPSAVHLYMISMTGGDLNDLGALPHAEAVIHGTQSERVRRVLARLLHLLDQRQAGLGSDLPVVILALDQFEAFRDAYYESLMPLLERLINEGHGAGIYVVLTATGANTVPERLRSLLPQRITLALPHVADYALTVGPLAGLRAGEPSPELPRGRGYISGNPPLVCQVCLPGITAALDDAQRKAAVATQAAAMRGRFQAETGQVQGPLPVRELPTLVALDELPVSRARGLPLLSPVGLHDDDTLSMFDLDWVGQGPHFLVAGPAASGKTTLLHTAALAAARQASPADVRLLLVDFTGRSFSDLARLKHTLAYVRDAATLATVLAQLTTELDAVDHATRPVTIILIDNYDLVSETLGPGAPLLQTLRDLVRRPPEANIHLWLAGYFERVGDPLVRQLMLGSAVFGLGSRESLYRLHLRPAHLSPEIMPPGRAYFAQYNRLDVVQLAWAEPGPAVAALNEQVWGAAEPAQWLSPGGQAGLQNSAAAQPDTRDADWLAGVEIDTTGLIEDLLGGPGETHD